MFVYGVQLAMAQKTNSDDRVSSWSSFDDSLVVGTATPSLSLSSGDEDRDEDPVGTPYNIFPPLYIHILTSVVVGDM